MSKNPLIVFEGIEGSGKTTHINNVANYLQKKKIKFVKIREPGGSKNSEKIRKLILNKRSNFSPKTDLFLYLAARNENIEKIISKNYKKKIILVDRFIDSTIAYQHYGMLINRNFIRMLNANILKKIKINFTFYNLVSKKELFKRLKKRKIVNRYDKFKFSFYKKVQSGFIKLSKLNKKNMIINSDSNISINKKKIISKIDKIIS